MRKLADPQKYAQLVECISNAKAAGTKVLVVAAPWVLGDNYEELTRNLQLIANAGLMLSIVPISD